MPAFAYSGRNASGERVQGVIEAADTAAVAAQLTGSGVVPLTIVPERGGAAEMGQRARWFARKPGLIDMLLFSRQMHSLLKAGVPILRALDALNESAPNPAMRDALVEVRRSLEGGRELSAALQAQGGLFSPFYVAMVKVGETTGQLEQIFLRLYQHTEFQEFMRNQVRSALRYPLFVIGVMFVALAVLNLFVIPVFAKVYQSFGANLPPITRGLIAFSQFTVDFWPLIVVAMTGGVFAFKRWTATAAGGHAWDRAKLRLPVAGRIIQRATLARFARSFALAMRSGLSAVQGLSLAAQVVDNHYVADRIERMREGVERGEDLLRGARRAEVFTPIALQMIMVGQESGSLDDMMEEVADVYGRDVEYDLKNLSAQIEPILIVMLGILLLLVALGVFLPIWDLGGAAFKR